MRHFPEGFHADFCLRLMGAPPFDWEKGCEPLASARLAPETLEGLQSPNTDSPQALAPILLILRARP
jgi:hypothetical protein